MTGFAAAISPSAFLRQFRQPRASSRDTGQRRRAADMTRIYGTSRRTRYESFDSRLGAITVMTLMIRFERAARALCRCTLPAPVTASTLDIGAAGCAAADSRECRLALGR